jgi:hypothetical protein
MMQTKSAATCNKNERRQGARNYANFRPNGQRRLGGPLKTLLDEVETGLLRSNW